MAEPPNGAKAGTVGDRMRRAYDAIAPLYAAHNAAMPEALVALGHRVLALAGATDAAPRVLDVGCGTGRDMAWFEARGAKVTGVDLSGGMLAAARTIVRGGLARMDMRTMALAEGRFDVVWSIAALHHLPKAEAPTVLAEMRRVLGPNGILAMSVKEGTGEGWEPSPYDPAVERFFARSTVDEAHAALVRAGFAVVDRGVEETGGVRRLAFLASVAPSKDRS